MEEYFAQSDLEKAQKLPVTPFMDRDKVKVPHSQINFIDSFLLPTFSPAASTSGWPPVFGRSTGGMRTVAMER